MAPGASDLGVGFIVTAQDDASNALQRIQQHLHKTREVAEGSTAQIAETFSLLRGKLLGIGAAIAGALGVHEAVHRAAEFGETMEQVAVRTAASHEALEQMKSAVWERALRFGSDVNHVASTLGTLAEQGLNAADATKALGPALDLAGVSMGRLGKNEAATALVQTLREFHMGADQAASVVDRMTVSTRLFGAPANEMVEGLKRIGLGAQAAGTSLDEAMVMLGLMRRELPSMEQASMSASRALIQLSSPQLRKKFGQAFGGIAIEAKGELRPLLEVLGDVAKKAEHMTGVELKRKMASVWGARGAGGMDVLVEGLQKGFTGLDGKVRKGADAVAYFKQQLGGASGAAEAMRKKLRESFSAQWDGLKGALSTAAVAIGEPLVAMLTPVMSFMRQAALRVARFFHEIPDGAKLAFGKVSLGLNALSQLFSRGWLDAKTGKELLSDSNGGILWGVRTIYLTVMRVKNALVGFWSTFSAAFERMAPTLERLSESFRRLRVAMGLETFANDAQANVRAWDSYGAAGAKAGSVMGWIAEAGASVLASSMSGLSGIVATSKEQWGELRLSFTGVAGALNDIASALLSVGRLLGLVNNSSKDTAIGFTWLGNALGWLGTRLSGIGALASGLAALWSVLKGAIAAVGATFLAVVEGMLHALLPIMISVGKGAQAGEWLKSVKGARMGLHAWSVQETVEGVRAQAGGMRGRAVASAVARAEEPTALEQDIAGEGANAPPLAAGAGGGSSDRLATSLERFLDEQRNANVSETIVVQIGDEKLATVVRKANRASAVEGFESGTDLTE